MLIICDELWDQFLFCFNWILMVWCNTKWIKIRVRTIYHIYSGGILDTFSLISRPPFIFFQLFSFLLSSCDLCGHFEFNKHRFHDNFFPNKNSVKGGFKKRVLSFQQEMMDFWKNILIKLSYFCVLHSIQAGHFKYSTFFEFQPTLTPIPPHQHLICFLP